MQGTANEWEYFLWKRLKIVIPFRDSNDFCPTRSQSQLLILNGRVASLAMDRKKNLAGEGELKAKQDTEMI